MVLLFTITIWITLGLFATNADTRRRINSMELPADFLQKCGYEIQDTEGGYVTIVRKKNKKIRGK